jgi:hypothetical protein
MGFQIRKCAFVWPTSFSTIGNRVTGKATDVLLSLVHISLGQMLPILSKISKLPFISTSMFDWSYYIGLASSFTAGAIVMGLVEAKRCSSDVCVGIQIIPSGF